MTVDIHQENGAGNIITLCQDLEIKFQDKMFIVPAGFQSDGASVPEFLWSSVSPYPHRHLLSSFFIAILVSIKWYLICGVQFFHILIDTCYCHFL